MRVGMLGPLRVEAGGRTVPIGGARLRAVLMRLALDAGRAVPAESLAAAVWPDAGPADPGHALQALMSRLRRALPGEAPLRSAAGGYRLDLAADAVDVMRFERLARAGRRALRGGEPAAAADMLRQALALWRGAALADAAGLPFAQAARRRLDELRLTALEDRIAAELVTGRDPFPLVAELEELAAAHPLRERPRELLVTALHTAGRPAEALVAYEEFRGLLAAELGADPGPELRAAHLAVLRDEEAPGRARSRAGRRGNVPVSVSSLVGRAEDRAAIVERLAGGRLVTLVGPGGVGKTRVATSVAAELDGDFPGGAWLVELAPVADPADVAEMVVQTLVRPGLAGLPAAEPGRPDAAAVPPDAAAPLVEALSAAETLLVLDNCEHVIGAVAPLVEELLGRCPRLRVLATSREPLGIGGEVLCPIAPLGLPVSGAAARDAAGSPAVRLFADRAAAARADFTVTDGNVGTVTEICRRLDGLPLAIELAAARLRSLTVEELAARLDDRFALLTRGHRTALPRHRTLRAMVDWSWDLLADEERRVAERLAAFPATISPAAAARVCALGPADGAAVLDALAGLVDRSLLQVVPGRDPRYRMLETIREYALARLAEKDQVTGALAAHAAYFLDLAERAEPHVRGPDQLPWLRLLRAEQGNLLGAFHFAARSGDAATAVRLAAALAMFWTVHGDHAEAARRLRRALDVPGEAPEAATAVAIGGYLFNVVLSGGYTRGGGDVTELARRAAAAGGPGAANRHPLSVLIDPAVALIVDDTSAGLAAVDGLLAYGDGDGGDEDAGTRATLWLMRAMLDGNSGDLASMHDDVARAVTQFERAGERWGLAFSLMCMGDIQATLGEHDRAIAALERSVRLAGELVPGDGAVLQRVGLAGARARAGDSARARAELIELVEDGARNPTTAPSARLLVMARIALGNLARLDGDLPEAAARYAAAERDLDGAPTYPQFRSLLDAAKAQLAVAAGDIAAAPPLLRRALTLAVETPDMPVAAVAAVAVARLRLAQDAAPDAARVLGAAHTLRGALDAHDPDVVRLVDDLRRELGDLAYRTAYGSGSDLDRAGALTLALAMVQARPGPAGGRS